MFVTGHVSSEILKMPKYEKHKFKDKEKNLIEENQLYEDPKGKIYLFKGFENNCWSGRNSDLGAGIRFSEPNHTENLTKIYPGDKLIKIKRSIEELQEQVSWIEKLVSLNEIKK